MLSHTIIHYNINSKGNIVNATNESKKKKDETVNEQGLLMLCTNVSLVNAFKFPLYTNLEDESPINSAILPFL